MNPIKLWCSLFISYLLFLLSFLSYRFSGTSYSFTSLAKLACCVMMIYVTVILFLQLVSNIFKSVYWVISGYKCNMIFLFPLLLQKSTVTGRFLISIAFYPLRLFNTIYPESFIRNAADKFDSTKVKKEAIACEMWGLIGWILCYIVSIFIVFKCNTLFLLPGVISMIIPILALAFFKTDAYHGAMIKVLNIIKGNGVYYIANSVILYLDYNNEIYNEIEKKLATES